MGLQVAFKIVSIWSTKDYNKKKNTCPIWSRLTLNLVSWWCEVNFFLTKSAINSLSMNVLLTNLICSLTLSNLFTSSFCSLFTFCWSIRAKSRFFNRRFSCSLRFFCRLSSLLRSSFLFFYPEISWSFVFIFKNGI